MSSDGPSETPPPTEHADDTAATDAAPEPKPSASSTTDPATERAPGASATTDDEASRALWPWVARRTRPQIIALVLLSCLALGPIVALVTILKADPAPVRELITHESGADEPDTEVTRVQATAMGVSPSSGELRARLSVTPSAELKDDAKRLTQPLSVVVNGAQGLESRNYEIGETPAPFGVDLPLTQGSTTRYPFDRYQGPLRISLRLDTGEGEPEPHPFVLEARSAVEDFVLSASQGEDALPVAQSSNSLEWTATRPATTTVYAVWLMVLMLGLAVTGVLIAWSVVIWMVDLPFWVFGYFVGVLFALPPLRDSLPGRPPPGTIFDFASFYWAVTVIGASLILMLAIWLRRTRDEQQLRRLDSDRPR